MTSVGRFAPDAVEEASAALRSDGVVILEDLWSRGTMDRVRNLIAAQHPEFADKASLADLFDNGEGRFIAPVTITRTLMESGLFDCVALDAVLVSALGKGFVHEAFGMMMVEPGAPAQPGHRDGGLLFPELGVDRVLPPSSVTVAIPLVDIGPDNAPTAFRPGSHRFGEAEEQADPVVPEVTLGSAVLWDFRVLHHGCANTTAHARPLAYFTASRPFWFDHRNFGAGNRRLVADADVIGSLGERYVRAVSP